MATARLTEAWRGGNCNGRPGWRLRFAFDRDAIDALKQAVPASDREWVPDDGYWWVSESYESELLRLFPGLEAYRAQGKLL